MSLVMTHHIDSLGSIHGASPANCHNTVTMLFFIIGCTVVYQIRVWIRCDFIVDGVINLCLLQTSGDHFYNICFRNALIKYEKWFAKSGFHKNLRKLQNSSTLSQYFCFLNQSVT